MAAPSALSPPVGRAALRLIPRSDKKLARLAAAGDERAFAVIYQRYHQELYRYCRAILTDPHDANDALQNTMASALRALPGETRQIELRPWLYRVARNESVSILRRRQVLAEPDERSLPVEPGADVAAESRESLRALVADLGSLPERQRSALVMRELNGLTHEEIAAALSISGAAARQVVYEARMALQELREGRAMQCEPVRHAISERDGRVLRGRKIRAHLRACEGCADFRLAIEARRADFKVLAPPLPAVAASGVLATVLGGGSVKGTGALGGLLAGTGAISGGVGIKAAGLVAASAAIGVGAGAIGNVDHPTTAAKPPPASESRLHPDAPAPAVSEPSRGHAAEGSGVAAKKAAPGLDRAAAARGGAGAKGKTRGASHGKGSRGARHGKRGKPDGSPVRRADASAAGGVADFGPAASTQRAAPPGGAVGAGPSSPSRALPAPPELPHVDAHKILK